MKINPLFCRFSAVDAILVPVLHKRRKWTPELVAVYVCHHPKRQDGLAEARSRSLPGVLCKATIKGKCKLCEDIVLHGRK